MLATVEAIQQPSGALKFLEPIRLDKPRHVLVTFTAHNFARHFVTLGKTI
jgi:hypothetical protein